MKTTVLLVLVLFNVCHAISQPGTLDPAFGTHGHVNLGTDFVATAFQTDGKLVGIRNVGGDVVVQRYNTDGAPDASFGHGGTVTTDLGSSSDQGVSVAVGSDNKIVVLANTTAEFYPADNAPAIALVRYLTNGSPDPTFGHAGTVIDFYYNGHAFGTPNAVAVENNGNVVVSSQSFAPYGIGIEIHLYDNTGNQIGGTAISGSLPHNQPTALIIGHDGKIIVGASTDYAELDMYTYIIARLNSDATTDQVFESDVNDTPISVMALATQEDGKIVGSITGNKLIRINRDGSPDATFGTGGVVTAPFAIHKIIIQNDGKIIVGGEAHGNFALARYNTNGTLDAGFGTRGIVNSDFGTDESISNMAVVGDRLYAYGSGILAAYSLSSPVVHPIVSNTSSGSSALASNTTGSLNTATGYYALHANTIGSGNTADGAFALQANTSGNGNTAVGLNSLYANTSGYLNTASGSAALGSNTTGFNNVAFGVGAGFSNNNFSSTFIGTSSNSSVAVTNSTALGYRTIVNGSNQVRIGNSAITSIGGHVSWTSFSDGRFKKNISEDVPGLSFINKLRPVTYTLDVDRIDKNLRSNAQLKGEETPALKDARTASPEEQKASAEKAKIKYTGFVAQEVEQAAKKINYDFSGVDAPKEQNGFYGLRYAEFVVPLVKAVQELSKKNDALASENEALKARLDRIEQMIATNPKTFENISSAYLQQNFPNPANGSTAINYYVPANAGNAVIKITDAKGRILKSFTVQEGKGQVVLQSDLLTSGTYQYSLYINGRLIDSKEMVVAK
jgi:uncharacterized delta-60 repeat protein